MFVFMGKMKRQFITLSSQYIKRERKGTTEHGLGFHTRWNT